MDIDSFVSKYIKLIDMERLTEHEAYSEKPEMIKNKNADGVLTNLIFQGSSPAVYDRIPVTFTLKKDKPLPYPSRFTLGDPVAIGLNKVGCSVISNGVIKSCDKKSITIITKKDIIDHAAETFFIFKLPNESCYKRMELALRQVQLKQYAPLIRVAFGLSEPSFDTVAAIQDFPFVSENLNEDQQHAVVKALAAQDIFIIHGPPGTGKTTTLVEIIQQFVKQKKKVLVCAGSNAAVDNITEKLWNQNKHIDMVRLGHIARFHPVVLEVSLDAIIAKSNAEETISTMRNDIKQLDKKIDSMVKGKERHLLIIEKKRLLGELRSREVNATESALKKAKVVLSTVLFDPVLNQLKGDEFDIVVIDECSQITEPACWISMLKAKRCILAGDHCQLPPVIRSEEAEKQGLGLSLMERLCALHGDTIMTMLTMQYRMHESIMTWPSNQFYEKKLVAHTSVATHLLKDLPDVEETENTSQAIVIIDTVATSCVETSPESTDESRGNHGEADLVAMYIDNLIDSGIKAKDIGVITPYSLQVTIIKSRLRNEKYEELEIKSVDGFQGREREAIVLSMVRSNEEGSYGFLSDNRRTNVAVTRAKRHLAMICNTKTVSCQPLLKDFLDYVRTGGGEIRSATQYDDVIGSYDRQEYVSKTKSEQKSENKPKTKKLKKKSPPAESKVESFPFSLRSSKPTYDILCDWTRLKNKYETQFLKFLDGPESVLSFPSLPAYDQSVIQWMVKHHCPSLKITMQKCPAYPITNDVEVRKPDVTEDSEQPDKLVENDYAVKQNIPDISISDSLNEIADFSNECALDDTIETVFNEGDIAEENTEEFGAGTDSESDSSEKSVLEIEPESNINKVDVIGNYDRQEYVSKTKTEQKLENKSKMKKSRKKSPPAESKVKVIQLPLWSEKPNYRTLGDWVRLKNKYEKPFLKFLNGSKSVLLFPPLPIDDQQKILWMINHHCRSLKITVRKCPTDPNSNIIEVRKPDVTEDSEQSNEFADVQNDCAAKQNVPDIIINGNLNEVDDFLYESTINNTIETEFNEVDVSEENTLEFGAIIDSEGDSLEKSVLDVDYKTEEVDSIFQENSLDDTIETDFNEGDISEGNAVDFGAGANSEGDSLEKSVSDIGPKSNTEEVDGILPKNILDAGRDCKEKPSGTLPKHLPKKKKKKKSSNSAPKLKEILQMKEEDANDFDAIIESVIKADKVCSLLKCKESILSYLPSSCDYCKRRFCSSHYMPEIHGCGAAVRADMRSQIRKEGIIYPGSGKPDKKPNKQKAKQLHKIMEEKLDQFSKERKAKLKTK